MINLLYIETDIFCNYNWNKNQRVWLAQTYIGKSNENFAHNQPLIDYLIDLEFPTAFW